jgi:3-oxoacyl-(acyl-carrier-protein) synthase
MGERIFVTSIGIISPIGKNSKETLVSLIEGKGGQTTTKFVDSDLARSFPLCEVPYSNKELADIAGVSKETFLTRCSLLASVAAKEAVAGAGIEKDDGISTGLICGTTVGGMDKSEIFYKEFSKDPDSGNLNDIKCHDCGDSAAKVAQMLGIEDFVTTLSTACSSSANSFITGARLLNAGIVERVVAGGVDALTYFTVSGFNSLRILDSEPCVPLDANRKGLNLGEAAAFAVIETEKTISKTGNEPICELKGWHNCAEAHHQTASSPEGDGAYSAMTGALEKAGLLPDQIDYINMHGTGTGNNDLSESIAVKRVFGDNLPLLSSTKGFTGHTLGAAGAVEAVISVISIKEKIVPGNLRFETPIENSGLVPVVKTVTGKQINNILSNSFGFGGNNSALIFSRYQK